MTNLQAIFWDFDGVILDSVNVKTMAFARMFHQYGHEIENAVIEYHLANGGISRFEKFKYYYNHLLGKCVSDEELNALGIEFSEHALEEVMSSPFIPGALETLQKSLELHIPSYVVSGTPDEEVRFIVNKLNLMQYFIEVHGSPRSKTEILSEIISRKDYNATNCVFIGDAMTDYEAARNMKIPFIGIVQDLDISCFPAGTNIMKDICIFNNDQ